MPDTRSHAGRADGNGVPGGVVEGVPDADAVTDGVLVDVADAVGERVRDTDTMRPATLRLKMVCAATPASHASQEYAE